MSQYVGAPVEVLANSMTGTFEFEKGDKREMPDFNVFYKYNATYPFYSDGIWFLTQMRRWGQIPEKKDAAWYGKTIKDIYRPDIWKKAADLLVAEGQIPANNYKPQLRLRLFSPPVILFNIKGVFTNNSKQK